MPTGKTFLKQASFALAGSCIPFSKLFAEGLKPPHVTALDLKHPKGCGQDLRTPLYMNAAQIKDADFSYTKTGFAIKDVLYQAEAGISACVTTIANPPIKICDDTNHHDDGDISVLRYHAYYRESSYQNPTNGHDYNNYPLPCIVLFHPGGFAECKSYLPNGIKVICKQLAARGFIAISISYRQGRVLDTDLARVSVQQQLAPYRAMQDGRGGIRSLIKRNQTPGDNHGNQFRIDESQFFIGGLSAGAVTAMGISFYRSQSMINNVFPISGTSLTVQQALGHINADYYFGEPGADLENPMYWPVIRGVLNGWGGITIPKSFDGSNPDYGVSESGFFAGTGDQINPPMIGFVGALDVTIPFPDNNTQNILNSTNVNYRKESFCLNMSGNYGLKDPGMTNTIYIKQCSAQNMYYVLKVLNRFTELYVDCNMAHDIVDITTDNFGVNTTLAGSSEDDVFTYIAIRAAIFFQTIMNVPTTAAFPPFNYRGKSLFISKDDMNHITNQRTCSDCDGIPASDTCNVADDPACNP